jgi:hypothetical protein
MRTANDIRALALPGLGGAALAFALLLGGCSFGGSRTLIIDPVDTPMKVSTVTVIESRHTANMSPEDRQLFRKKLAAALYEDGQFTEGGEMVIEYRILLHDPGDQAARYFIGLGAGEAEVIVEVSFLDQHGEQVSEIECSGRLTMGTFGGDFHAAYDKVVEEIVSYVESNFLPTTPRLVAGPAEAKGASQIYDD